MVFLNYTLLAGLTAISVPIIIHLLNRRKFEEVRWAAMRFLKVSIEQNQRRLRIEDLLLLLMRCLLVALLVLALARMALKGAAAGMFGQTKVTGVLVIDNSASMAATDGQKTRLELAKQAAEQALDSMPVGSRVSVILASDIADAVIPVPTLDVNLARKTIREATLVDRPTNLYPAFTMAMKTLDQSQTIRRELYIFTDGQLSGWEHMQQMRDAMEKAKENVRGHLVFVGSPQEDNLGISGLRMVADISVVNRPLRYEVQVTNYGNKEADDVHVTLRVDGEPPSDEGTIAKIEPGKSQSVNLSARFRDEGYHGVTASLPGDRVPADDTRTLAARALTQVRVLLVDGHPGTKEVDSEVYYVKQVLRAMHVGAESSDFVKSTVINTDQLESTKFDDYDVVILADVTDTSPATLDALADYLRRGRGGLMIFPGDRIKADFYNGQMGQKYGFLPATFGDATGDAKQQDKFVTFSDKGLTHPIVDIWKDPSSGSPAIAHFFRKFDLAPLEVKAEDIKKKGVNVDTIGPPRVVLSYSDGRPAVVERTWGQGRVIEFSSTASTAWNDLPTTPVILPLLYRSLGALVQRQDEALNIVVGDTFNFRADAEQVGRDAVITRPGQSQTQAASDSVRVAMVDNAPMLSYTNTSLAGAYQAALGSDAASRIKFAAQAVASESELETIGADQKGELAKVAQVVNFPQQSLAESLEKERVGTEIWAYFAAAALMLAIAETFLAHWFSKAK